MKYIRLSRKSHSLTCQTFASQTQHEIFLLYNCVKSFPNERAPAFSQSILSRNLCYSLVLDIKPPNYASYFFFWLLKLRNIHGKNWGKQDSWFDVTNKIFLLGNWLKNSWKLLICFFMKCCGEQLTKKQKSVSLYVPWTPPFIEPEQETTCCWNWPVTGSCTVITCTAPPPAWPPLKAPEAPAGSGLITCLVSPVRGSICVWTSCWTSCPVFGSVTVTIWEGPVKHRNDVRPCFWQI